MTIKRFELDRKNIGPDFIGSWVVPDKTCENIINFFENNQSRQSKGSTSRGTLLEAKDRQDITILPKEITLPTHKTFKEYFEILSDCYKDYKEQWPFLKSMTNRLEIGKFNIGRYQCGQHFQQLHTERCSINTLQRLFAFMTYLNDVEDGGSTYFSHYDLDIKPQKGLTII